MQCCTQDREPPGRLTALKEVRHLERGVRLGNGIAGWRPPNAERFCGSPPEAQATPRARVIGLTAEEAALCDALAGGRCRQRTYGVGALPPALPLRPFRRLAGQQKSRCRGFL